MIGGSTVADDRSVTRRRRLTLVAMCLAPGLTLLDVTAPAKPEKFAGAVESVAGDIADPAAVRRLVASQPHVIFHLAAVVSADE